MRRQVKPFVTEYRGAPRRGKDPSIDHQQDGPATRNRSFAEAEKVFQSDGPEDSYEAALRAADALFNTPVHDARRGEVDVENPGSATVCRSDPPLGVSSGESSAQVPAIEDPFAEPSPRRAAAPPRRILQAIEQPDEDRFAALEAERAPKRRGRKPGSKNKSKPRLSDDWQEQGVVEQPSPAAAKIILDPPPVFAELEELAAVADDVQTLTRPKGRNNRFGWKRDGLRPGERWKRRLPKTARRDSYR